MTKTPLQSKLGRRATEMAKNIAFNEVWCQFATLSNVAHRNESTDDYLNSSLGMIYSTMGNNRYPGNFKKERIILDEFVKTLKYNKRLALDKFDIVISNKKFSKN